MENPENEIKNVVTMLTAAANPDVQKAAVEQYVLHSTFSVYDHVLNGFTHSRYYASNAEFHHPLCAVGAGRNSRDSILGILQ